MDGWMDGWIDGSTHPADARTRATLTSHPHTNTSTHGSTLLAKAVYIDTLAQLDLFVKREVRR